MDYRKVGEYAKESPLYTFFVITSSAGILYSTTVENQIQDRWILPSLKKMSQRLEEGF